jgi:hypothetical protein
MRPISSRLPDEGRRAGRDASVAVLAVVGMLVALPSRAARVELHLSEPDGRPLAAAVLYALPLDGRRLPPPADARMDQHDRRFIPQILPVQTGAAVSFPNTDSISHHVYSFSPAKRFELYLPKEELRASARGPQTDALGRAELADLSPGHYRLVVWHPRITDGTAILQREAKIGAGDTVSWQVHLRASLLPARDQEPGFKDY